MSSAELKNRILQMQHPRVDEIKKLLELMRIEPEPLLRKRLGLPSAFVNYIDVVMLILHLNNLHNMEKERILGLKSDGPEVAQFQREFLDKLRDDSILTRELLETITEQVLAHNKNLETDDLTGLLTIKAFREKLAETLKTEKRHCALLFTDLREFKPINDSLGHKLGDVALQKAAKLFSDHIRIGAHDLHGRYGGDEFVAFLSDVPSLNTLEVICDRTLREFKEFNWTRFGIPPVKIDIGVVYLEPDQAEDRSEVVPQILEQLFDISDRLMYNAKGKNKNGVETFALKILRLTGSELSEVTKLPSIVPHMVHPTISGTAAS